VPFKHGEGYPFIEVYFHYGINGKNYVSPITYGNPDPFVEFADKLKSTGDREDWLLSRKFDPKMRTYAPIVVRGQERQGVKFWGFGKTVYQELLGLIADEDWGDIADPINGKDIVVKYEAASGGQSFPTTNIIPKPKSVPLTEDRELLKKLLDEQPTITEMFEEPTYDELKKALQMWLKGTDDAEDTEEDEYVDSDDDEEEEKPLPKSETVRASKKSSLDIDDVTAAFDDVFNDD
jgi:hypothetical protein